MANRWLVVAALALFSLTAMARGPAGVRKQVESSMRLAGTIEVSKEGNVATYALEDAEALPPGVVKFLKHNIENWKFDPVMLEGKAVTVRNKMSILLVAKKAEDDQYTVRLQAASFKPYEVEAAHELMRKSMDPPRYPEAAVKAGVTGTVYMVVKVGRDGKVEDAVAEQVNLQVVATENRMQMYRKWLAEASLQAARNWQFTPPTMGDEADAPYWSARVPVDFLFHGMSELKRGKWHTYVPGPKQPYPWAENEDPGYSPEALAGGGVHMVGGKGLRLLTPLGEQG